MASIVLGKRPETFAPFTVSFKGPDGRDLTIPGVVFKYRTRKEFAALVDKASEEHSFKPKADEPFKLAEVFDIADTRMAKLLVDSVVEWGLDQKVSAQALQELTDEVPAAAQALWEAYQSAARDGRLGN